MATKPIIFYSCLGDIGKTCSRTHVKPCPNYLSKVPVWFVMSPCVDKPQFIGQRGQRGGDPSAKTNGSVSVEPSARLWPPCIFCGLYYCMHLFSEVAKNTCVSRSLVLLSKQIAS